MKIRRLLAYSGFVAALSACNSGALTPDQLAAKQAAFDQADTSTCIGMGAAKGTDAFVACRLRLVELREASERQERVLDQQRRQSMSQTLDSMAQNIRPTYQPYMRDGSFSCRSNSLFGTTTTNCSPY